MKKDPDLNNLKPNQVALVLMAWTQPNGRRVAHFHALLRNELKTVCRNEIEDIVSKFRETVCGNVFIHRRTSAVLNGSDAARYQIVYVFNYGSAKGNISVFVTERNTNAGTAEDRAFCKEVHRAFSSGFAADADENAK